MESYLLSSAKDRPQEYHYPFSLDITEEEHGVR